MDTAAAITRGARAVRSLAPAIRGLRSSHAALLAARRAAERGHFTPDEDELLRDWQARYLTARTGLFETIEELRPLAMSTDPSIDDQRRLRCFAIAYAAVCLVVGIARFIVDDLANDKIVQRKLNEGAADRHIPRKEYTRLYRSLTDPANAWHLAAAMRFADDHRVDINALAIDPELEPVITVLRETEDALRVNVSRYLKARLRYRVHAWRRRHASAMQQAMFGILELGGRVVADIVNPFHENRISSAVRDDLADLLQPGDVIIARHDQVLSNLFLPGYWPHAALHIGPPRIARELGINIDEERASRWIEPKHVLEAKKDGVLFRPLEETLATDAVAVIRPRLAAADIARAIGRAVTHEGKLYNFDMDFFTADRVVCTEIVYRAYDGIGDITFPLSRRAGILTLSAEDVLDQAREDRGFGVVAVFGTPSIGNRLVTGDEALTALRATK